MQKGHPYAQAWNFGPKEQRGVPVKELVTKAIELWGHGNWRLASEHLSNPEMSLLRLSWDKAAHELEWEPVYHWIEALEETVQWFKAYQSGREMYEICIEHIDGYVRKASKSKLRWTGEENLMEMKSCALHTHL